MKGFYVFILGLVCGLSVGFFFLRKEAPAVSYPKLSVSDYLPAPTKEYIPQIQYQDTGTHTIIVDSIPYPVSLPVDTLSIVKDYLTVRNYQIDTTMGEYTAQLDMNIYANRLLNYDLSFSSSHICKNFTNNGFKIGLMAGYHEISPMIAYTKEKYTLLGGYNIYENQFKLGLLIRLSHD